MTETIFALATARGKAGIAVIRVSGPRALAAVTSLGAVNLEPRRAALRRLMLGDDVLDEALVLFFPRGASFTGEESVEIQAHGSVSVVAALLSALGAMPDLRMAEPGEFTRRALENGRLDLTQVEGLADLIDAETESQRKQAQRVLSGALGARVDSWRQDLIRAAALIEASIDFVDEDVPVDVTPEVGRVIDRLMAAFRSELDAGKIAERIRVGFEVAIIGSPNVGKSSLLNALAGREAAITSAIAGTTRDVIEVRMDIGGFAVTLLDTAGLRETEDEIEQLGIARARERALAADLRIVLLDPQEERPQQGEDDHDIVVWSKADLSPGPAAISSKTGVGLDWLLAEVERRLSGMNANSGLIVRERHRIALMGAFQALELAQRSVTSHTPALELVAADLRSALSHLELLVGKVHVEVLLDEIFASFCIGK
ncbi:MAG: tRNA uridine-5-carboxymethylaminomethyl(34) synthesis GTPase MnmE [Rhodobacteraceae bacterium]|nr:tRNA uridine-5-carboxymethylaminomethyl(34) synthesis GTPase MnmE [Paracoccaceae bacterium]